VKPLNVQALKLFIGVVDEGNFTKAAEKHFVTQPYLSQLVKQLEKEYEVKLLNRSTRQVTATDAGKVVYAQAKKMLACMHETDRLLDQLKDVRRGEITLAIPPLVGTVVLPKLSKLFRAQYPAIKMHLIEVGAKNIPKIIKAEEADIGFCVMPLADEQLTVRPYISSEFVIFISAEHPLAKRCALSMKDLRHEDFILFSEGFTLHDAVLHHCQKHGFSPNVSFETSQWDLMVELIALQMGVALLPKSIANMVHHQSIHIVPLREEKPFQWEIAMVTKTQREQTFAAKAFEDIVFSTT